MKPIEVGFFSFTEILDGDHRTYNEWHMLDHMPEQFALEGIAFGQRWVSTPACHSARRSNTPRFVPADYVTLYLMTEPVEETLTEFFALGRHLASVDRFHKQRRACLSGAFTLDAKWVAPRVLIDEQVVPFRPCRGIYVVVAADPAPGSLALDVQGVAGAWSFADAERRITVAWLDEDPLAVAAERGAEIVDRVAAGSPVELAGPFETVTPWKWDWFDST